MRVLAVGNPGVGKSFILNALLGHAHFHSDVSLCVGLTKACQELRTSEDTYYVDTPGLDCVSERDSAAFHISEALSVSAFCKLLFIITLSDGRIRPADIATLRVVVDALRAADVEPSGRYCILVNKCSSAIMSSVASSADLADMVTFTFSTIAPARHVAFFPLVPHATREADVVLHGDQAALYRNFVDEAPMLHLKGHPIVLDVSNFNNAQALLQRQICRAQAGIHRLRRNMTQERQQPRNVCNHFIIEALSEIMSSTRSHETSMYGDREEWIASVVRFCVDVGMPVIARLLRLSSSQSHTLFSALHSQSPREVLEGIALPQQLPVDPYSPSARDHIVD